MFVHGLRMAVCTLVCSLAHFLSSRVPVDLFAGTYVVGTQSAKSSLAKCLNSQLSLSLVYEQPFEAVFRCMRSFTRFLERLVMWPKECGHAIMNGTRSCPRP